MKYSLTIFAFACYVAAAPLVTLTAREARLATPETYGSPEANCLPGPNGCEPARKRAVEHVKPQTYGSPEANCLPGPDGCEPAKKRDLGHVTPQTYGSPQANCLPGPDGCQPAKAKRGVVKAAEVAPLYTPVHNGGPPPVKRDAGITAAEVEPLYTPEQNGGPPPPDDCIEFPCRRGVTPQAYGADFDDVPHPGDV